MRRALEIEPKPIVQSTADCGVRSLDVGHEGREEYKMTIGISEASE